MPTLKNKRGCDVVENFPCKSCEEIHELNGGAPSGEYTIRSSAGKETKVRT